MTEAKPNGKARGVPKGTVPWNKGMKYKLKKRDPAIIEKFKATMAAKKAAREGNTDSVSALVYLRHALKHYMDGLKSSRIKKEGPEYHLMALAKLTLEGRL